MSRQNMTQGSGTQTVRVGKREISLSKLDKIFYPGSNFTKGQIIDYYVRISKYVLPHLKNRPVTLKRFPDGVRGEFFYEKNAPSYTPKWVKRFAVPSPKRGSDIHYILINDLATLIWLANAANLELHPFLHRVPRISRPTSLVFDLDPGEGADVLSCGRVALLIRDLFAQAGLQCWVKVSGSKGLQLYAPLNNGSVDYSQTKAVAQTVAQLMEHRYPHLVVSKMAKSLRFGKVLIDWSQNDEHKTTVGVYSLRAKEDGPFVSAPVTWEELDEALKKRQPRRLLFPPERAARRCEESGDLFEPVLTMRQRLPETIQVSDRAAHAKEKRKGA